LLLMRLRPALALATIALAALLPGCGSSHTTKHVTGKQREAALRQLVAMRSRLLKNGELRNYRPSGLRTFGVDAASWVRAAEVPLDERTKETERLEKLGFAVGLQGRLNPAKQESASQAVSVVEQFESEAGARGEVAAQAQLAKSRGASEFSVAGIPTARGFGASEDLNIAYAAGRYYYLVGVEITPGDTHAATRADLIAAAKRQYARVSRT
jgi:hypothetical protein